MRDRNAHPSDADLLMAAGAGLSPENARHLAECPACRARRRRLEDAAADFARAHRQALDPLLPPAGPARERLSARLSQTAAHSPQPPFHWQFWHAAAAAALVVVCTWAIWTRVGRLHDVPIPRLTPGAARTADRDELCNSALPKNEVVPADLRRRVFQAYGIADADPRKYEVDYLITPALGGANDIRNLWPQPYVSTVWNARVKDELEDRLRDLVCAGQLDLAEAQRDISTDWIAAYKKYFRTERPGR